MTEAEFIVKQVRILADTLPRGSLTWPARLPDMVFDMYLMALRDIPLDALQLGFVRIAQTSRFMPTPAEIRAAAGYGEDETERAALAWQQVRLAISKYDAYQPVRFDDSRINAAIRAIGGWTELCDSTTDELKWKEKAFVTHYKALRGRPLSDEQVAALPGLFDQEPKRIGVICVEEQTRVAVSVDDRRLSRLP